MKKKPEQKNAFSHIVMILDSGIQKINGLSCGICLMENILKENISVLSQSRTGPKWMCGVISLEKTFRFHRFISLTKETLSVGTTLGFQIQIGRASCREECRY